VKILLAGDWHSTIHEKPLAEAFSKLGHEVVRYGWAPEFRGNVLKRAQGKFLVGPVLHGINRALQECVRREEPELVFVYRGTPIFAQTIENSKAECPKTLWVGYNNDDPFSSRNPFYLWRHFLKAIPFYDWVFAYRTHNKNDYLRCGAQRVELLRSWYIPELNRPVALSPSDKAKYQCDVAFVGHFEPDGREAVLKKVIEAGIDFKLYGPEWHRADSLRAESVPRDEEYNKAINGAKISLCFLSKLNRDTYTRRCFEIPAAGSVLVSEYSEDLAGLFVEGVEFETFRNADELVSKLKRLLSEPDRLQAMAAAGRKKVLSAGHDVLSRAKLLLETVQSGSKLS
jgi:spore maturation protein CgeB